MKYQTYTEEHTEEVEKEQIEDFESVIKESIELLSKRVQELDEIDAKLNFPLRFLEEHPGHTKHDYWMFWYEYAFNPLIVMKLFRYSRLKYLHRSLESLMSAYESSRLLEFSFHLRHFIEVSAAFGGHVEEIIESSKAISKFDNFHVFMDPSERIKIAEDLFDFEGDFIDSIIDFAEISAPATLPSTIKLRGLKEKLPDKGSLRQKKGEFGFNLTPNKNIGKHLDRLQRDIKKLRPIYDLLSEFIHPNSYILLSQVDHPSTKQYDFSTTDKLDDEEETIREFFIRLNVERVIHEITNNILSKDDALNDEISDHRKHIKKIVNSVLGLLPFADYLNSKKEYKDYVCLCGSNLHIGSCCVKTSKKDMVLLKKRASEINS